MESEEQVNAKEQTRERIAVMQAWAEGEEIECCDRNDEWKPCLSPAWNWVDFEYRVKPKPREWWLVLITGGLGDVACESEADAKRFVSVSSRPFEIVHVKEEL